MGDSIGFVCSHSRYFPQIGHVEQSDQQEVSQHGDRGSGDIELGSRNLPPVHGHLHNGCVEALSDAQQFDIKAPAIDVLIEETFLCRLTCEEFETALRVLDVANIGDKRHQKVESKHQEIAQPIALGNSVVDEMSTRSHGDSTMRVGRDDGNQTAFQRFKASVKLGGTISIDHEQEMASGSQHALFDSKSFSPIPRQPKESDLVIRVSLNVVTHDIGRLIRTSIIDDNNLVRKGRLRHWCAREKGCLVDVVVCLFASPVHVGDGIVESG